MLKSQLTNNHGKYAVEILIAIAIIAFISVIAIPQLRSFFDPSKPFYGWDGIWRMLIAIAVTLSWVICVVIVSVCGKKGG